MTGYLRQIVGRLSTPVEAPFPIPVDSRNDNASLDASTSLDDPFDTPVELPLDAPNEAASTQRAQAGVAQASTDSPEPTTELPQPSSPAEQRHDHDTYERTVTDVPEPPERPVILHPEVPPARMEPDTHESQTEQMASFEPVVMPSPANIQPKAPPVQATPELTNVRTESVIEQIVRYVAESNARQTAPMPLPAVPDSLPELKPEPVQMIEPPERSTADLLPPPPPQIVIGDVVVEITNPPQPARPAAVARLQSAPRQAKPVRSGVPSKRRFGIGQS